MQKELKKWGKTIEITWANRLAYKFDFILEAIVPALVFFLIQYNLWKSIYSINGINTIQGYTFSKMIEYQAWVLIVTLLAQCHNGRNLADDIRLGRISSYLLYPFEFWKFHFASFLGLQSINLVFVLITLVPFRFFIQFSNFDILHFLIAFIFTICVGVFWFLIQFTMGLIAFWLEETWVLRVIFYFVAKFLSGGVLPLELFPKIYVDLIHLTPFPYLTYVPVQMFMGTFAGSYLNAFLSLFSWLLIMTLVSRQVWKRGVKLYSAAGM